MVFCMNEMMSVKNASYVTFVLNNTMEEKLKEQKNKDFTLQMKDVHVFFIYVL